MYQKKNFLSEASGAKYVNIAHHLNIAELGTFTTLSSSHCELSRFMAGQLLNMFSLFINVQIGRVNVIVGVS